MAPQLHPRLLAVFGGLALSLAVTGPANALAQNDQSLDPTAPVANPVADEEDEEHEARPGDRLLDGIVKRLERLAEQARKRGNEEMAERLERRIEQFKKRADGMRRMLRDGREGRGDRKGHRQGRARPRPQKHKSRPRGRRPGPEWEPAPPRDSHHHHLQPNGPDRGREERGRNRRRDDHHPRSGERRFEERRFEFREERPDRRRNRRRAPERRSRNRDDGGVELFFGLRLSGRRIELGISPGTRQLRIRIDQGGNERELRFRLGDNPLDTLRELRRGLMPQKKRNDRRPNRRRRTPRRHTQRTSLL